MGKRKSYKKHQIIGGWKLEYRLGKGGNGEVWRAQKGKLVGAIKLLKNIRNNVYTRFRSEVHAVSSNQDIEGVVELIDYYLPTIESGKTPWYVMPVGKKFSEWRKGKGTEEIASEMLNLAKTLKKLHDRDFSHRDIKPANILYLGDRLCLSDFGLVKYPGRDEVTVKGTDVGPKYTMAPEMRRNAVDAKGQPADVYSFAKTLWIGITNEIKCFDGQYNVFSTISINHYCHGIYTKTLNDILTDCTEHDPYNRPNMAEVISRLEEWVKINSNFHDRNLTEWFDVQNKLFPAGAPNSVTWENPKDILTILNEISQVQSLNHMFLPGGGGHTLLGADYASEEGFISLKIYEKMHDVFKPKKLTYESFGVDPQWNYFRLEVDKVDKTSVYEEKEYITPYEELVEIEPGKYIERHYWDFGEYEGEELPEGASLICRYFEGSFVIFSTRSIYNQVSATYDGRHNKMSERDFRGYIRNNALTWQEHLNKSRKTDA